MYNVMYKVKEIPNPLDFQLQNFDYPSETGTACNLGMRTEQHAALVSHDADASHRKIDENQNRLFWTKQLKTVILRNTVAHNNCNFVQKPYKNISCSSGKWPEFSTGFYRSSIFQCLVTPFPLS